MGAASFVGRVGGLAVAMGVGTAILSGYGVASAESDSAGSPSPSSESSSTSPATSDDLAASSSPYAAAVEHPGGAANLDDDVQHHRDIAGVVDRHRPGGRALTDAPGSMRFTTPAEPAVAVGSDGAQARPAASGRPGGARRDESTTLDTAPEDLPGGVSESLTVSSARTVARWEVAASSTATARHVVVDAVPAQSDVASPRPVVASVAPSPSPSVPANPQTDSLVSEPLSSVVLSPAGQVSGPLDTNTPAPPADVPTEWLMAALARRELSVGLTSGSITVNPTLVFGNGVIVGALNATDAQNSLFYTVIGGPSAGGKVKLNKDGNFRFLPYGTVVDGRGAETFTVMVSEKGPLIAAFEQVPLVGKFFADNIIEPIAVAIHQVPILGGLWDPIIGHAVTVPITVDIDTLVPAGMPVAFTVKVASFDGTLISTNFFPAPGLQQGDTAPTIFDGPGLGGPGELQPDFRLGDNGYNVITWDPRGEFDSGGVLNLNSPFFEGRDMSALIDWLSARPEAQLDGPGDPRMGMIGGSYGGAIQLVTAATDHRVDAIVPAAAWHTLTSSLYKDDAFKTAWATGLFIGLVTTGARFNSMLFEAIVTGNLLGVISESAQAFAASSGPGVLVDEITAPTLLIQGTVDTLFSLQEATTNAQILDENGVPVKMIWLCDGHGVCLTNDDGQTAFVRDRALQWLNRYVKGQHVDTGPKFEFFDQNGQRYSSALLPSDPAFYADPVVASGGGGILPIVPLIGGSGPQTAADIQYWLWAGGPASIALNLTTPAATTTTQIVGAPELTFTYSGLGTTRHVYAQLVDNTTGLVLGNIVTPIPVTLDGQTHTVTIALEQVAHTLQAGDTLSLQLVGSTLLYENFTSFGVINVSGMELTLPTPSAVVAAAGP